MKGCQTEQSQSEHESFVVDTSYASFCAHTCRVMHQRSWLVDVGLLDVPVLLQPQSSNLHSTRHSC